MNPKIVFLTFAMMLSSTMGFAQGSLLKKLGDKAIGAAEKKLGQKVEQSVSRKVGDVLGVSGSESATTASGYAENLLDSNSNSGIFAPDIENSTYTFTTYAGAMSAATKKTSSWASAKSMAATLNGLILNYTSMPHMIFDCPLVSKVWED